MQAKGKFWEAIDEHREAIRLKPDDAEAHYNLGNALKDSGDVQAAIAEFRKAIQLKPDYASAHEGLGIALSLQGKLAEATAEHREVVRLKPGRAPAHGRPEHQTPRRPGPTGTHYSIPMMMHDRVPTLDSKKQLQMRQEMQKQLQALRNQQQLRQQVSKATPHQSIKPSGSRSH